MLKHNFYEICLLEIEGDLRKLFCPEILCLLLVNVLHQHTLVLEHIALYLQV